MVNKASGLPMHANLDPNREHLIGSVQAWLRARGEDDYLGIHQRLDLETSGVVILVRDRALNSALAAAFEGRRVRKVYRALCRRPRSAPPNTWRIDNHLAVVGRKRAARTVSVAQGGQRARTEFLVLDRYPGALLMEARPTTGRKHQIRAHLSEAGLPIFGDRTYGGPPAPRVMLHAYSLSLPHPRSGQEVTFVAPEPSDFLNFQRTLKGSTGGKPSGT